MAYTIGTIVNAAASASSSSLPSVSATYAANDRAIVFYECSSNSSNPATITDGTNTYTLISELNSGSGTTGAFECLNCAAGTFSVTGTLTTASSFRGIAVVPVSGLQNSGAAQFARQTQVSPGTGTDALTSTNITPSNQPALLFGFCRDSTGTTAPNIGTGFTTDGVLNNWDSVNGEKSRLEDKRLTSVSAVAATFTAVTGTDNYHTWGVVALESVSATLMGQACY